MRIHRIELKNYRGISHQDITFSDGVTIVQGPNEVGKSSIPESLRRLRDYKDSSNAKEVLALQPSGRDVGPQVTVELTTGPYRLRYHKRWLKDRATELDILEPRPESFTGGQAHDRYQQILKETVDTDLFDAMQVQQGQSMEQAPLKDVGALQQALDTEDSNIGQADQLLARINAEYQRFFTASGQQKSDLKAVLSEPDIHRQQVKQLQDESQELDQLTAQMESLSRDLVALRERQRRNNRSARQCQREVAGLQELQEELKAATAQLDQAQKDLHLAEAARAERQRIANEVSKGTIESADRAQRIAFLLAEVRAQTQKVHRARAEKAASTEVFNAARKSTKAAAERLQLWSDRSDLLRLRQQLEDAEGLQRQQTDAASRLAVQTASPEAVEQLEALQRQLQIWEQSQISQSSQVTVKRVGEGPITISSVDTNTTVADVYEGAVSGDMEISVGDIACITITAGSDAVQLQKQIDDAKNQLASALYEVGFDTVQQAQVYVEKARIAAAEEKQSKTALEKLLGTETIDQIRQHAADLEQRLRGADLPDVGTRADFETAYTQCQVAEENAEKLLEAAAAAYEIEETKLQKLTNEQLALQSQDEVASKALTELTTRLDAARESNSDTVLDEAVARAQASFTSAQQQLEQISTTLEDRKLEEAERRLGDAQDVLERTTKEIHALNDEITRKQSLIEDRASRRIYDRLAEARAKQAHSESQARQAQLRADTAQLLRNTFVRHREEAQAAHIEPYRQQLRTLGERLFGAGFDVQVNQDLTIETRTLGGRTVPFASLSGGAKEQLALLGRLAGARLVDKDDGVPVFLDDTLGFTDPTRLERLGSVLSNAGDAAQIIVLTCQPERFSNVGKATVVRLPQ